MSYLCLYIASMGALKLVSALEDNDEVCLGLDDMVSLDSSTSFYATLSQAQASVLKKFS